MSTALDRWQALDAGGVRLQLRACGTSPGAGDAAGRAVAEVSVAPDGSVRLRAAPGETLPPDPGPGIGRPAWEPAPAQPREREDGGVTLAWEGRTGAVQVEIEPRPLRLRIRDRAGALLAELSELFCGSGAATRVDLATPDDERLMGFGEKRGPLDKRGRTLRMRTRDPLLRARDELYVAIPFFLALRPGGRERPSRARGVLLDALGPSRFEVDAAPAAAGAVRMTAELEALDLTFFPGPRPADVLARFTARVGRTPLPPRWALGHHQSRWSYASERAVRRVARELRTRGIPTDAIHLDIDHMRGYRIFTWHPRRFPDPKGLLADLAADGLRAVAIVDPGVKVDPAWDVYAEGVARDLFCKRSDGSAYTLRVWPGDAALPDFQRAEVRAWWADRHAPLLDAGVAGVWNDMNEPAGWKRDVRLGRVILPLRDQDTSDVVQRHPVEEREVPHEAVRNVYALQQCRATRDALEAARPGGRPFVLTRSGHAGIQRHAAVWTGDVWSTWSHLRESLPMLLGLSLSGVAFCGADIGGFQGVCTPELYARWVQIGALQPFARTHASWAKPRQEPWRFGPRVERIARSALRLRMRLLPYLYGLFHECEATGAPVWRPLAWEFPECATSLDVEDQVMVGPSLLAAPVLERGARERELWLPPGPWVDWHTGARYAGPRRLRVPAPLERLPLFARGGSLVPTQSPVQHTGETPREPVVLQVFPGGDAASELVEDDGESLDYRLGRVARTPLRLRDRAGGRLRVEIGRREGDFAVGPRRARVVVHGCGAPRVVTLDGGRLPQGGDTPGWSCSDGRVHVRLLDRGASHSLEIEPAP